MNLYGQDMDDTVTPAESGLAWTVDFGGTRDFVGRRALEHEQPRRKLVGLVLLDRGVLRGATRGDLAGRGPDHQWRLWPTLGRSIALARVPNAVQAGDSVQVEIRERLLDARVVNPPFVRNGTILIGLSRDQNERSCRAAVFEDP